MVAPQTLGALLNMAPKFAENVRKSSLIMSLSSQKHFMSFSLMSASQHVTLTR
jgi:hypothetical protein|tara:strand:- start:3409 stop:3567 length:159 start_codon:yes stop_codon:yes gene_type:complete